MLGFGAITFIVAGVLMIGWLVYMDYKLDNPDPIPETEQEKSVRDLKERIKVADWRFKRSIGEV
jgi:hypothetical protein|tara:strand:+ start:835 stop:1026 length:192 start_codon:yes stop_codon:yes gene_type:complete